MAIGIRVFPTNGAESLLAARGVQLAVDTPEQSLARVRNYYLKTIGSEDLERVGKVAQEQGPVILGSNSCGNCSFVAGHPEEVLVSIKIDDGLLHIAGRFRDEDGQLLIELSPGKRPTFSRPGARL
jgi:hypothetical protein